MLTSAQTKTHWGVSKPKAASQTHIASATVYALKIAAFEPKSLLTEASFPLLFACTRYSSTHGNMSKVGLLNALFRKKSYCLLLVINLKDSIFIYHDIFLHISKP